MRRALLAAAALLSLSCDEKKPPNALAEEIQKTETAALKKAAAAPACRDAVDVFAGELEVAATDSGDARDLDRVLTRADSITFTLDDPFQKKFAATVTAPITLRRSIDAIRAGFRRMYEGTTQIDIPNMMNKEVTGPYGRSFHAIGDLVIESIGLCADGRLEIGIGS